ncbi:universal stress protein [Cellulosimicrobium composti]|uniref:Universal stress protein n=1 Tax=Cellulosimicrobium composti TaxID=2672572 RepID=A0A6N7ZF36_9MICO|nr:universal stress protein [Cellulosimicrobium composti]MTG87860.1 universal stress protein [Cellulosimicrobium composti]NDO88126.1 universal stress protein [Cellulosimicrobium composti]TWG74779.1 universal stress protein family protein [Cellulosimicrobium cellulans J34]SMF17999.1 Universal stress protein family protein [Cellulosimicrobium cellulans J1]
MRARPHAGPVPQPALDRMVPFAGHAVVVGVVPGGHPLVVRTAAAWAAAADGRLVAAYADTSRHVVAEHADGSVTHAPLDPDHADDAWQDVEARLRAEVEEHVRGSGVPWDLRYLAGRPDRALTHLARAVDAAVIVVGTRSPGTLALARELVEGSVALHLAHHQHRPVLTVPLTVVDWEEIRAPWET